MLFNSEDVVDTAGTVDPLARLETASAVNNEGSLDTSDTLETVAGSDPIEMRDTWRMCCQGKHG